MPDRFMTRVAVFVVVRNEKGEILLQQRGPKSYLAGHWDFPSGHGEQNEALHDSAIRELREEVGLIGSPQDLRLIHIDQYFVAANYINFVFALDTWTGTPNIGEPDKCSAIGWFAPGALPEKCVNVVRAVEAAGFSSELTYSVTDRKMFEETMGLPRQII